MTTDPQPTTPEPHTYEDHTVEPGDGHSATAPAEGGEHVGGVPRDPSAPDD